MDNIEGNHEPSVLTDPWLYSYCHATQLRRSRMGSGSLIFFCDHQNGFFDTVFVVREKHRWNRLRPKRPHLPVRLETSPPNVELAWKLQFKWPARGYHENANLTFEGSTWPLEPFSFLPLLRQEPLHPSDLPLPWLERLLGAPHRGKRPLALASADADTLYRALRQAADELVVGGIRLIDGEDIARVGMDPLADKHNKGHCVRLRPRLRQG